MLLLISLVAALISSIIWYFKDSENKLKIGTLSLMFWGASIMWFVDSVFEYNELREEFFNIKVSDMINDAFLGVSVVVLGVIIWMVILLVSDPKGVVKKKI